MIRMTVTLQDEVTGVGQTAQFRLDPTSGSPTLQASVWTALTALYQTLVTAVTAAQPTLPPTLT